MTNIPRIPPLSVEIVAYEQCQLLDVAGPLQVFNSCNTLLEQRGLPPAYSTRVVSRPGGLIMTSAGLPIDTLAMTDDTSPRNTIDTVIVAGGFGVHTAVLDPGLLAQMHTRFHQARRQASVCSGAFMLAATGWLDGRRAATHWDSAARLAREHPAVEVDGESIYIADESVWTSAGVTAGIDMALAMVEADVNRATALSVARHLVVYLKRPGGQSQFSETLASQGAERFAGLHAWIRENLSADLRVPALASRLAMSERQFARRYVAETGNTPAATVEKLRVERARQLLEEDLPLARVATLCGFGAAETLRRAFLRTLGIGPGDYRRQFASTKPAHPASSAPRNATGR